MWKWHQKIKTALCNLRPLFPIKGVQWNRQFWAQILRKNKWNQTSAVCFRGMPLNIRPEFSVSSCLVTQSSGHEPYECKLIVWTTTLLICALVLLTRHPFWGSLNIFLYKYTWHCHVNLSRVQNFYFHYQDGRKIWSWWYSMSSIILTMFFLRS